MSDKGFTVWFTGLSGSGKTTVSQLLKKELLRRGLKVEILDGDEVRTNLSEGLGFSKEDRDTNILRIGYVCKLLSRNGVAVLAAAISPYRETRRRVRAQVENFVEVFCRASLEALSERDIKGLYRKAQAGEIKNFTGVSDPYEEPENAEVVVESDKETAAAGLAKVLAKLEELGLVPVIDDGYSPEEEETVSPRWAS